MDPVLLQAINTENVETFRSFLIEHPDKISAAGIMLSEQGSLLLLDCFKTNGGFSVLDKTQQLEMLRSAAKKRDIDRCCFIATNCPELSEADRAACWRLLRSPSLVNANTSRKRKFHEIE